MLCYVYELQIGHYEIIFRLGIVMVKDQFDHVINFIIVNYSIYEYVILIND